MRSCPGCPGSRHILRRLIWKMRRCILCHYIWLANGSKPSWARKENKTFWFWDITSQFQAKYQIKIQIKDTVSLGLKAFNPGTPIALTAGNLRFLRLGKWDFGNLKGTVLILGDDLATWYCCNTSSLKELQRRQVKDARSDADPLHCNNILLAP